MSLAKRYIQRARQAGIYQRLKASRIHDLYWAMTDRQFLDRRDQEVDFYRDLLGNIEPGSLIFDIGANVGDKTDVFLKLGGRIVSVEPDEANQEVLRGKFLRYRVFPKSVTIVGKAVSDRNAVETMWIDGPGSAVNTFSKKWADTLKTNRESFRYAHFGLDFTKQKPMETITIEDLIAAHGVPLFVKIDVEGYEPMVIRGLKRPVPFLSFEVNLPAFRDEGLECVRLLSGLARAGTFNYAVDLDRGMALETWRQADEFLALLERCSEGTIEVFWRTQASEGMNS